MDLHTNKKPHFGSLLKITKNNKKGMEKSLQMVHYMLKTLNNELLRLDITPARTLSISGLKSRLMKLTFSSLKMMLKSGLEFSFEIDRAPSELLLPSAKKSAQ